jgi:hypothetical protein
MWTDIWIDTEMVFFWWFQYNKLHYFLLLNLSLYMHTDLHLIFAGFNFLLD